MKIKNIEIGQGRPKIAVSITGKNRNEILKQAEEIKNSAADIAEWRIDFFDDVFSINEVLETGKELYHFLNDTPVIITFRTKEEGGEKEITYKYYKELLEKTAENKIADIIDVEIFKDKEIDKLIHKIKSFDVKVIGSNHDFNKTPEKDEILSRLKKMDLAGCDICKIAVMPENLTDVLTLMEAGKIFAMSSEKIMAAMSMGQTGLLSRLSGSFFNSAVTFGAIGEISAPGQIQADDLCSILDTIYKNIK